MLQIFKERVLRSPRRWMELIASHIKKKCKCLHVLVIWGRRHMLSLPTRKQIQFPTPRQKKSMQERYCEYIVPTKIWNSCFLRMMFKVIDSTLSWLNIIFWMAGGSWHWPTRKNYVLSTLFEWEYSLTGSNNVTAIYYFSTFRLNL